MYLLSLLRGCCHVVEIGRVPSTNATRGVSTMTTADSAVYFLLKRQEYNLLVVVVVFRFDYLAMRIAEKVEV